ncbi:MAG TPA: type VI secretion system-associated protein TagF [Caulobacteraceae bacterium]
MTGPAPFVFGKLPGHGDFVQRGLGGASRDAWDHWASAGLARAREVLGERFDTVHEQAPPWRFCVGPGPLGPDWRVGALAPSVDRVGRRFLIVVGADGLEPPQARSAVLAERMEGLIYDAFEGDWDADGLVEAAGRTLDTVDWAAAGEAPVGAWIGDVGQDAPRLADIFAPDGVLRMLELRQSETPS